MSGGAVRERASGDMHSEDESMYGALDEEPDEEGVENEHVRREGMEGDDGSCIDFTVHGEDDTPREGDSDTDGGQQEGDGSRILTWKCFCLESTRPERRELL